MLYPLSVQWECQENGWAPKGVPVKTVDATCAKDLEKARNP